MIHRAPLPWLLLSLSLLGCEGSEDAASSTGANATAAATAAAEGEGGQAKTDADPSAEAEQPSGAARELDQLLAWLSPEPLAVAYDRMAERLDPRIVEVVFAIPPKAADLLDERGTLDEGLDIVFDGEAEASNWLGPTSLAFTVALSKTPYFLRPLTKPAAEVGPLLELGGFAKTTFEDVEVWLPDGSFPWRIALLDGEVAAFIPVDLPGAGLEPLNKAKKREASAVETELARALTEDGMIELVLFSAGPLVHFDMRQTIAQVRFTLFKISTGSKASYEGQIQLTPSGDPDEAADSLRARSLPEENQQIQALVSSVEFQVVAGAVVGRLAITPDQIKHFLDR